MKNLALPIRIVYWLSIAAVVATLMQMLLAADHQMLLIPVFFGGFAGWLIAKIFRGMMLKEQNKGLDKADWEKLVKQPLEELGTMAIVLLVTELVSLGVAIAVNVIEAVATKGNGFSNVPLAIIYGVCVMALMLIMSIYQIMPVTKHVKKD